MTVEAVGNDIRLRRTIVCRHCSTINQYLPIDVRVLRNGKDWGGGPDGAEGFNCANCGREVVTKAW